MTFPRFLAATILLTLPIATVRLVKQSDWGPILAAPKARRTGDPKAPLTIVEYSDFQCPSCANVDPSIHQFLEVYKGKIQLIYKYYPLTNIHKNAMTAAHAAECAARQGHFWPYHDRLFQTQLAWAPLQDPTTSFLAIAQDVRLDMPSFRTCYADSSPLKIIEQDAQEARDHKVNATPTFIIGDERLVGPVMVSDGARTIEKELRR